VVNNRKEGEWRAGVSP